MKILKQAKKGETMKLTKKLFSTVGVGSLLLVASTGAMAQGINTVTNNVMGQMPGITDVLSAVAYIAGIGFGIKAALKLREHNETKGQVPISTPITLGVVAALLLALPTFLSTGKEAVFGTGSTGTNVQGGTLRTVR